MLLILALLVLFIIPVIMTVIRFLRPRTSYQYLLALFGAVIAWILVLLSRPDSTQNISLYTWQPESLFPYSPALLLDRYSWAFALALTTLLLGVMLTAAVRMNLVSWQVWAGEVLFSAIGLLAVLAGNPLTLLIAWAALDLFEAVLILTQTETERTHQRVVLVLSLRAAGTALLLLALILSWSSGTVLSFSDIQAPSALILIIAAALRLGVLPLHHPFISEAQFRRGLGTVLRLVPAAASFILLSRAATVGIDPRTAPLLLVFLAIAALYGAISWAVASQELSGRTFWILGMASLGISASIKAQPESTAAWGVACVLSGAFVFLASPKNRSLQPFLYLGVISISGLPFTPLWEGWSAYGSLPAAESMLNLLPAALSSLGLFFAHILLVLGYIRHVSHVEASEQFSERWVWVLYIPGLALLLASHFIYSFFTLPELNTVPLAGWLSGVFVSIIALVLWLRAREWMRSLKFVPGQLSRVDSALNFSWLFRFLLVLGRIIRRFVDLISKILEGEGGLLWAMLIVLLLFSLLRS